MYGMPDEIDVKADGALRIITLNRPDALNAVNDALHVGLAKIWEALNELHLWLAGRESLATIWSELRRSAWESSHSAFSARRPCPRITVFPRAWKKLRFLKRRCAPIPKTLVPHITLAICSMTGVVTKKRSAFGTAA